MPSVNADELENATILADPPRAARAWVCPASGAVYLRADMVGSHAALPDDIHDEGKYLPVPGAGRLGLGQALLLDFVRQHMPDEEAQVRADGFAGFTKLARKRGLLARWHAFRHERTQAVLRAWCAQHGLELSA